MICNTKNIINVFELKKTPPADMFLPKDKLNLSAKKYPLTLALCKKCGYLHLPYMLDPALSYSNYVYETKVTVGLSEHYREYAEKIISFAGIKESSLVVDLGSNDGTMLRAFKERNMNVLGVEPNRQIAKIANEIQLETINEYFTIGVADHIKKEYGKAMIITANYMYANIKNIYEFTGNVKNLLDDKGLFVIQTGYHPEQIKVNMFDYVYHEHFSYFTVKVLRELLKNNGLELIHVSLYPAKGGSISLIAQHIGGKRVMDESVESFINNEISTGMHDPETYIRFADEIDLRKKDLLKYLQNIKSKGHVIVGYGASHSTTTLLHHFEMGDYIDYLVDDNPIKHGLYSPGYHLPVYPSKKLYDDKPKYVLVLGWQHQDFIINRNRSFLNDGGQFIIPLPKLKIVND